MLFTVINYDMDEEILRLLKSEDPLNSQDLEKKLGTTLEILYPVLNSLQIHKYVNLENKSINKFILTKEAQQYAEKGMPEFVLWNLAGKEGRSRAELEK